MDYTLTTIKPYTSKTQKTYVEGWELLARMKKDVMEENWDNVIEDVRKQFNRSRRYEFNSLASEFATSLHYYFSIVKPDKILSRQYKKQALKYHHLAKLEQAATIRFSALVLSLNESLAPKDDLIDQLRAACDEFKEYLQYESTVLWTFTYKLLNSLAAINQNHQLIISQSHEIINRLEKKGIERVSSFYKDMAYPLILEGRYEEGRKALEIAMRGMKRLKHNWNVAMYRRVVLEIHDGNYQEAYNIYCLANKRKQINKPMGEMWMIVKGYFKLLSKVGLLDEPCQFKLYKFLNETNISYADKAGNNTHRIILKLVLNIQDDIDKVIEEREAIQRYAERYLAEGSRQRIFFQMLNHIAPGDFNPKIIDTRIRKNVEDLPKQRGYNPSLEVIPYEILWRTVMKLLE